MRLGWPIGQIERAERRLHLGLFHANGELSERLANMPLPQHVYDPQRKLLRQPLGGGVINRQGNDGPLGHYVADRRIGRIFWQGAGIDDLPVGGMLRQAQVGIMQRQQKAVVPRFAKRANNVLQHDEIEHVAIRRQRANRLDTHAVIVAVQRFALTMKGDEVRGGKAQVAALHQYLPRGSW